MATRKWILFKTLLGLVLFATFGCSKSNNGYNNGYNNNYNAPKTTFTLSGNASGSQEVPAVTTSASGTLSGSYNSSTKALQYTINWNGLSGAATAMHFHGPADPGANAGVALGITGFTSAPSGTYTGSATLTDAQESELLAGKWYYNIHTDQNKGGEIRGQVSVQ